MRALFFAAAALSLVSAPAFAVPGGGQSNKGNGRTCSSPGATADNPGQWLQDLREVPVIEGMTPAEIAEKEHTTPGWVGYGETPNVGALIDFFCEGGRQNG